MKNFRRLLGYTMRYRSRFLVGVVVAFLVALLNSASLASFLPLFSALGKKKVDPVTKKELPFAMQFSEKERHILNRFVLYNLAFGFAPEAQKNYIVPAAPLPINAERANRLLWLINNWSHGHARQNERAALVEYHLKYPDRPLAELEGWRALHKSYKGRGLNDIERTRLQTDIKYKLKLNSAAWRPRSVVWLACGVMLICYVLRLALTLVSVKLIAGSGYMAVRDLREELYDRMQRLPLSFFYKDKTGELVSRMINDVEAIAAVISSNMRDAITNVFLILTTVMVLAYINFELFVMIIVVIPIMLSPVTLFTRKIRKSVTRSQELMAGLNGHLGEALGGMRVIRSHAMEEYESKRFKKVNDRLYWRTFKQLFYLKLSPYMVEFNSALVALGVIALGAWRLHASNFTGAELLTFFIALLFIIRPVIQLSSMLAKVQGAEAAGKRVFSIIDREPESRDPEHPLPYKPLKKSIAFENVSFTYPGTDKQVLHGIDIDIPAGSTVALVGESGGGKSTMMDLMARFFDPTSGRILIDGEDIRNYKVADHRQRIGIVTQDIFLFYGSIFQNIAYGSPDYERKDVERAARLAHAHDFIKEFYEGYHTLVGNRGASLSGGQRQRIAIARALLRDPEILILDEATSALDTESERLVQEALGRLLQNRTTFLIAHRLSTVEKADIILVVSDGRIIDQGTHSDLMKREGLYARLQEISRTVADLEDDRQLAGSH